MRIDERTKNGVTIIDAHGKITLGEGSTELKDMVCGLLSVGKNHILLNLADIAYIDSSGIVAMCSCLTLVSNCNSGAFKLVNLTKKAKELLAITKLLTVFDIYDDEAKAIASFDK